MVRFYSDTNSEARHDGDLKFSIGGVDYNLSFVYEEYPVQITGNSEKDEAIVSLGNELTDICIRFIVKTTDMSINELIAQAIEILDDYLADYKNGVN